MKRERDLLKRKAAKREKIRQRDALLASMAAGETPALLSKDAAASGAAVDSPIAFLFPGQGSQAVGMLKESQDIPAVK